MSDTAHILKKHHLRQTNCRQQMIAHFSAHSYALAHSELEQALTEFDRVTIYRTLYTFLEKGIVHKVLDDAGATRYALCAHCTEHQHHDEHVHFKCMQCQTVQCIDTISIPNIQLPQGYSYIDSNFLVRGVCRQCNQL
ncbi:MAG: transcriptional repressor [Crocinitomicaceae bacterium]|nr:MAG: transcriptional repressor [Crocinitomicaceae bacterium]